MTLGNQIDRLLSQLRNEDLRTKLSLTLDHTLRTIAAVDQIYDDREGFNAAWEVDLQEDEIEETDFQTLCLLMYLHDFFKLSTSRNHAEQGWKFLSQPMHRLLIRFHDILGAIHLGEASLLFLTPIISALKDFSHSEQETHAFLETLFLMTVTDVTSVGMLNQARITTYRQAIQDIQRVLQGEDMACLARHNTVQRLQRLIACQNRSEISLSTLEDIVRRYARYEDFTSNFAAVRFDAGAYVLEPLLRYLVVPSAYTMDSRRVFAFDERHTSQLLTFITIIHGLIEHVTHPCTIDLQEFSIKHNQRLSVFETWAKRQIQRQGGSCAVM